MLDTVEVIFVDIDGTLVSFETHAPVPSSLEAFQKLQEQGIAVVLASGRSYASMASLGLTNQGFDGYVCSNGQKCFSREGEVLRSVMIDSADVKSLLKAIALRREAGLPEWDIFFIGEEEAYATHIGSEAEVICRALNFELYPTKSLDFLASQAYYQLLFFGDEVQEREVMKQLPRSIATRWHAGFIDILPSQGGKGYGVEVLLNHLHIPPQHALAFGDGENDISMFEKVGFSIAMGNATKACRDAADYVTKSVDDHGIRYALEAIGLLDPGRPGLSNR